MRIAIGFVVVMGSVVGGFIVAGGKIAALIQISEYIVIVGAMAGSVIIANPPSVLKGMVRATLGMLKGDPYNAGAFRDLMLLLNDLGARARKEGLLSLEQHIDKPQESDLFQKYPSFLKLHHAVEFLTDSARMVLDGSEIFSLDEIMDHDCEAHHEETGKIAMAMNKAGDSLPGFGIVACVLGVVITMQHTDDPKAVGHHIAAALVGTFLGVLLAYGFVGPLAQALESSFKAESSYMACIRAGVLSMARGEPPVRIAEAARRSMEPSMRISAIDLEQLLRERSGAGGGE